MQIERIIARQILDSRGNPTVEAEVWCQGGWGRAAAPSGASTGEHEAHELRDGAKEYGGKGVLKAVHNIENEIADALNGISADDQFKIDEVLIELDGTSNKSRLGANAILAVSLATAHAAAQARHLPLFKHLNDIAQNPTLSIPMPMLNVLNGGQHAANSSDFQEFMIIPTKAENYAEALRITAEIFAALKQVLREENFTTTVGDEGGFAPSVSSNPEMLELLSKACRQANYAPGTDVHFALDVAASELLTGNTYELHTENKKLSATEMINYLDTLTKNHSIISIEDGLGEDEWTAWSELTKLLPHLQLVGDDLLVTNHERLEVAVAKGAGNAILIKPNQIGTLSETIRTIQTAKKAGWNTIISHRSGETEDTTIAHLAVGTGAGQIKTGSVSRGERTAKHNELLRIEMTNPNITFAHPFSF